MNIKDLFYRIKIERNVTRKKQTKTKVFIKTSKLFFIYTNKSTINKQIIKTSKLFILYTL